MKKFKWAVLIVFPVLIVGSMAGADILEDLVLNYTDFNYVTSIAVGFDYVYFGTTNGVTRYNISKDEWADPLNGVPGLRGNQIYEVRVSFDDESVWVQTEFGIFEYNDVFERWDQKDTFPNNLNRFGKSITPKFDYFPPEGYLYRNEGALTDYNGNSFPLTEVVADDWGNHWIGTDGLGAIHASSTTRHMEIMEFGLLQPDVTSIFSDNGVLWIGGLDLGSFRSGLTSFDWRENRFSFVETGKLSVPIYQDINCLFGNSRNIFIGTDDGVLIYNKDNETIDRQLFQVGALPGRQINSLFTWGDSVFIGTNFGLGLVDLSPDSTEFGVKTLLGPQQIYSLLEYDNFLWIGTDNGTFRMNLYNGEVGRLNLSNYASHGDIFDIEKEDDMIWIATQDEIVSIDARTATSEVYTEPLRHGGARALAVSDSLVAAATRDGLLILWTGKKPRSRLYTEQDGLISSNVRDVLVDGDYIWVGTDRGLTRFWLDSPSLF